MCAYFPNETEGGGNFDGIARRQMELREKVDTVRDGKPVGS